jgi:AcrR family transcriptional regulator
MDFVTLVISVSVQVVDAARGDPRQILSSGTPTGGAMPASQVINASGAVGDSVPRAAVAAAAPKSRHLSIQGRSRRASTRPVELRLRFPSTGAKAGLRGRRPRGLAAANLGSGCRMAKKRRGWGGSPPDDDDQARERIVEAAMRCLSETGVEGFSLSIVADEVAVTRPTVYRYFSSTDELFAAVAANAAARFTALQAKHLAGISNPAEWVVEAVAFAIERVPKDSNLMLLLSAGRADLFGRGFTGNEAMAISRELFERSSVDWAAAGFERRDLDEIEEVMLRVLHSVLASPPRRPLRGAALRAHLRRWLAPAIEGWSQK